MRVLQTIKGGRDGRGGKRAKGASGKMFSKGTVSKEVYCRSLITRLSWKEYFRLKIKVEGVFFERSSFYDNPSKFTLIFRI